MKINRYIVVVTMLFSFWLGGCTRPAQPDPRTQPDPVRLTTVGAAQGRLQTFTGSVVARVESNLGFRVSGKVIKRYVDAGQRVRAGQPLMRIDVTDYTHAITSQSQLVAAAKARADQASADEARYRGLVSTGAVSASTYDQVKAGADAAQAQLASAEAQERVAADQGDYSLLMADADGIVVQTLAEPGQVIAAGQTVVSLAHAGPREAAVYLPETVRPVLGTVVRASLYGGKESADARLRQLSDSADPFTRTFEARFVLSGPAAAAPLGATVTVELPGSVQQDFMAVPLASLTDRAGGPGVWVFNKNTSTVSFRPVRIARLGEEEAYLSEGLRPGEEIVALGAHLLRDGQKVRAFDKEVAAR